MQFFSVTGIKVRLFQCFSYSPLCPFPLWDNVTKPYQRRIIYSILILTQIYSLLLQTCVKLFFVHAIFLSDGLIMRKKIFSAVTSPVELNHVLNIYAYKNCAKCFLNALVFHTCHKCQRHFIESYLDAWPSIPYILPQGQKIFHENN